MELEEGDLVRGRKRSWMEVAGGEGRGAGREERKLE